MWPYWLVVSSWDHSLNFVNGEHRCKHDVPCGLPAGPVHPYFPSVLCPRVSLKGGLLHIRLMVCVSPGAGLGGGMSCTWLSRATTCRAKEHWGRGRDWKRAWAISPNVQGTPSPSPNTILSVGPCRSGPVVEGPVQILSGKPSRSFSHCLTNSSWIPCIPTNIPVKGRWPIPSVFSLKYVLFYSLQEQTENFPNFSVLFSFWLCILSLTNFSSLTFFLTG
jgi:hypothetical protein